MVLKKQIQFELTNFMLNKLKYITYVLFLFLFIGAFFIGKFDLTKLMSIEIILCIVILFVFNLCCTTTYEKNVCEFTINKLIYYPTTKKVILVSRCIIIFTLTFITYLILCGGYSIGCLLGNNTINLSMLHNCGGCILIGMACILVQSIGVRTIRGLIMMACIQIPALCTVLSNSRFDFEDMIACLFIIGINFIISVVNLSRMHRSL